MSLDGELLLPPDVEIFSVRKLTPKARATIDALDEDYAITRHHMRAPSRIVDKQSADLLSAFRAPTRIVDAVLSFAAKRGLDPEATLEQSYPLFHHLYHAKVLVPANGAQAIENELEVGGVVEDFRLLRCVQVLDDNEVFLGRNPAGQYAAVKFYRKANRCITANLDHEAGILRRLHKKRAPELFSLTRTGSGIALLSEWIFGQDATNAAEATRREGRREQRLLALCVEVATAYAELHEAGVLHGDVHPRNVLVEGGGSVRLIDFGFAQTIEQARGGGRRGGVAFYFDPEFARSQDTRKSAMLTPAGEQYSVSSLLYQLWTGVYYLDWSLERDELLRQIVEQEPASFEARGLPAWPALEDSLRRGLQKRPEHRFGSMREMVEALRSLLPEAEIRDRKATLQSKERAREKDLLDRALRRYALGGEGLRDGPSSAPLASINYGAAGVAHAMYLIALHRGDPRLLALADVWIQRAYSLASASYDKAFFNPEIEIEERTVGRVSLYHSPSGLHCIRVLISTAMGDVGGANRAIQAFVQHSRGKCENPDLTLGRASLLVGCAELVEAIAAAPFIDLQPVYARGEELTADMLGLIKSGSISSSEKMTTLGIAHGWAGLIFAVLRWARATNVQPDAAVVSALDELATLAEPNGSGLRWPVNNPTVSSTYMDGWCNGTAGHTLLYALAHEVLDSGRYAEIAERAALSVCGSHLRIGTLCCGLAGIAYAQLAVHRLTSSETWLERARATAHRAAADSSKFNMRDALYKGSVGVAVLAEQIQSPELAAMPLFEAVR